MFFFHSVIRKQILNITVNLLLLSRPDSTDQLRLDSARTERQYSLRLLLAGGAARLLPGPGHDGHRHCDGVELRVHACLRGQLRRERRGGLHPDLQGDR